MLEHNEKLWDYANNFMYVAIKDRQHLTVFIDAQAKQHKFDAEELEYLAAAWELIKYGEKPTKSKKSSYTLSEPLIDVQDIDEDAE